MKLRNTIRDVLGIAEPASVPVHPVAYPKQIGYPKSRCEVCKELRVHPVKFTRTKCVKCGKYTCKIHKIRVCVQCAKKYCKL